MNSYTDKATTNKGQRKSDPASKNQHRGNSTFQFVDNKPETVAQRKLQRLMSNSAQQNPLNTLQKTIHVGRQPNTTVQFQALANSDKGTLGNKHKEGPGNSGPLQRVKLGLPAHAQQGTRKHGPSDEYKVDKDNEFGHGAGRSVVVIETNEYPHMEPEAIQDWIEHMGNDPDAVVNISQKWRSHLGPPLKTMAVLPRGIRAGIHPGERLMTVETSGMRGGGSIALLNNKLGGMGESDVQHISSHPGTGVLAPAHGHIYLHNGGDAGLKAAREILGEPKKEETQKEKWEYAEALASTSGVPKPLDTSGTDDVDEWED